MKLKPVNLIKNSKRNCNWEQKLKSKLENNEEIETENTALTENSEHQVNIVYPIPSWM